MDMKDLVSASEKLGLTVDELKKWVEEEQARAREERAAEREAEREQNERDARARKREAEKAALNEKISLLRARVLEAEARCGRGEEMVVVNERSTPSQACPWHTKLAFKEKRGDLNASTKLLEGAPTRQLSLEDKLAAPSMVPVGDQESREGLVEPLEARGSFESKEQGDLCFRAPEKTRTSITEASLPPNSFSEQEPLFSTGSDGECRGKYYRLVRSDSSGVPYAAEADGLDMVGQHRNNSPQMRVTLARSANVESKEITVMCEEEEATLKVLNIDYRKTSGERELDRCNNDELQNSSTMVVQQQFNKVAIESSVVSRKAEAIVVKNANALPAYLPMQCHGVMKATIPTVSLRCAWFERLLASKESKAFELAAFAMPFIQKRRHASLMQLASKQVKRYNRFVWDAIT